MQQARIGARVLRDGTLVDNPATPLPASDLVFLDPADTGFSRARSDAARKRLGGDDAFPEVYDKVRSEDGISDLSVELAAEKAAGKTVDGKKGK